MPANVSYLDHEWYSQVVNKVSCWSYSLHAVLKRGSYVQNCLQMNTRLWYRGKHGARKRYCKVCHMRAHLDHRSPCQG